MCIVSYRGATGISRHPARPSDPRKPARRSSEECVSASLSVSLLVGSHLHRLRNSRGSRCGQFYTVVGWGDRERPWIGAPWEGGPGAAGPRLAGQRSPGLPGRSARGRAYASKGSGVRRAHHTSRHSPCAAAVGHVPFTPGHSKSKGGGTQRAWALDHNGRLRYACTANQMTAILTGAGRQCPIVPAHRLSHQ